MATTALKLSTAQREAFQLAISILHSIQTQIMPASNTDDTELQIELLVREAPEKS